MAYNQPQHGGAADEYYQEGQQDIGTQQGQYTQQPYGQPPHFQQQAQSPQQPHQQPQYQQQGPDPAQQYPQQPPQYGQQPNTGNGEKIEFDQTFKVDKPKYNDIWAAVLFISTFAGFIAVSVLSIHGYATSNQGGGIYNGDTGNTVSLDANTVILLWVESG
jgi:hypothetical protein